MVRSARIERATLCLEGRCSIQLSYERTWFAAPNLSAIRVNIRMVQGALQAGTNEARAMRGVQAGIASPGEIIRLPQHRNHTYDHETMGY